MTFDPASLPLGSALGFVLVFLGGVLTSLGPCNVAMIPLVMGYVGGATGVTRWRAFGLSLVFALGLAVTFVLLGVAAALVGGLIGGVTRGWFYLVALVCFAIGLHLLGAYEWHWPTWFGGWREAISLKGIPGALGLGLVSGLVASQCATPVLAAILTYAMAEGTLAFGAALMFVYALGRGVPVVLAGTFTGALKRVQALGRWSMWMERASGIVLLGVGLYFVWLG